MSTRVYQTNWRGQRIDVMAGWDPRLHRFFLVVEGDHGLLRESDLTPAFPGLVIASTLAEEQIIYSNLNEPGLKDPDLTYFLGLLGFLGISVPTSLPTDLLKDAETNLANANYSYGFVASGDNDSPDGYPVKAIFGATPHLRDTPLTRQAGLVVSRSFDTFAEKEAYLLGVSDARGHQFSREVDLSQDTRTLYVVAKSLVDADELHKYDSDVAGRYAVELPADFDDAAAASAALDNFHENVPVKILDDFEFMVEDADGKEVFRGDHEDYAFSGVAISVEKVNGDEDHEENDGPRWVERHGVHCKVCGDLVDERDCLTGLAGEGDICPKCAGSATKVRIEGGHIFARQADGSWTDGDLVYEDLAEMGVTFDVLAKGDPA